MTNDEYLDNTITEIVQGELENVHTALPAKIVTFDGSLASVQPSVRKKYRDGTVLQMPVINGVPVMFPRTIRGGFIYDLLPGDFGFLVFSERNIDNWVLTGADSTPADSGKFDLNDCIFIPGVHPKTAVETNYKTLTTTIARNDIGQITIKNSLHSLNSILSELITILSSLKTFGSPASHTISPATVAQLTALQAKITAFTGV